MILPDCPHCSASATLEAVAPPDARGNTLCQCACCSKPCRVDARGQAVRLVEQESAKRDLNGVVIDGP